MRIDFTKPVRTRSGCAVRILCTDARNPHPVIGLLTDPETSMETAETWAANGAYSSGGERDDWCGLDLVQADVSALDAAE